MKQEKQKEDACKAVLLAVQAHEAQAGIEALALVLKGSKSKRIMSRKLYESGFYGSLFYHPVDVIENFIKQCIKSGLLATTDLGTAPYPTPVLALTEAGRKLLESNQTELVQLQVVRDELKPAKATPAITETCRMMQELRSVEQVAKMRNVAAATVYDYLADGVELGLINLDEAVSKEAQAQIKAAVKGETRMRNVKAKLPESVSYGEIKCVVANERRS
jgi:superfamily II DNA helicase RecQ